MFNYCIAESVSGPRGFTISRVVPRENGVFLAILINPLLTELVRSRWLSIGLDSVNKNGKRNLANIQPSLPSAWSISKRARPPLPLAFVFFWGGKSCKSPTVGPDGSSKNPTVEHKKSGQIPYPGPTLTLHFPLNKLQMPYLVYRKSVII